NRLWRSGRVLVNSVGRQSLDHSLRLARQQDMADCRGRKTDPTTDDGGVHNRIRPRQPIKVYHVRTIPHSELSVLSDLTLHELNHRCSNFTQPHSSWCSRRQLRRIEFAAEPTRKINNTLLGGHSLPLRFTPA